MKKLAYIDALRGIAIIGVILAHIYYGMPGLYMVVEQMAREGARGVQLFYVASAFTIFLSYRSRSQHELNPVRNFYIRRFFRIAPMYWLGIVYYLWQNGTGSHYWLADQASITPLNILSNFTFLHGLNPYWINSLVPGGWSIAVEMMFYMLCPLLFLRVRNINQAFTLLNLTLVLNMVLSFLLSDRSPISSQWLWQKYLMLYLPSQMPVFSLGILMYFILTEPGSLKRIYGINLILLSAMWLLQSSLPGIVFFPPHFLFGIGFLLLGLCLSRLPLPLLVNPVLTYIGRISFSIYLSHFAVIHWMEHFRIYDVTGVPMLNFIYRFGMVLGLAVIISTITYRLIEVPMQQIGKRFIRDTDGSRDRRQTEQELVFPSHQGQSAYPQTS
jgi:peptidoglycan/LPS O-acetylase OafA/YrhL